MARIASLLVALTLAGVPQARAAETVVKPYTFGPAPTSLCRTDSTIGGACFEIPEPRAELFVRARDSLGYWAHFRLILLDENSIPIVHLETYGEHCADTPGWLRAPAHAATLLVEIAEDPSFMASWCPHVSDDGAIEVTFRAPLGTTS